MRLQFRRKAGCDWVIAPAEPVPVRPRSRDTWWGGGGCDKVGPPISSLATPTPHNLNRLDRRADHQRTDYASTPSPRVVRRSVRLSFDLVEARLRPIPILTSRRGCATCSGSRRRLPVPDDRYVAVGCGQPTRAASPRQQSVPGVSNAGSVSVDVRDCEVSAAFSWSSRCPVPRAAHRLMPRGRSASNDRRPAGNTAH